MERSEITREPKGKNIVSTGELSPYGKNDLFLENRKDL